MTGVMQQFRNGSHKIQIGCLLGGWVAYQKDQVHRLAVYGCKIHTLFESAYGTVQCFQACDACMGHGNTVADTGAFRALPGHYLIQGGVHPLELFGVEKKMRQLFQRFRFGFATHLRQYAILRNIICDYHVKKILHANSSGECTVIPEPCGPHCR
ncbi:MAG: hypothetical protein BWY09_02657 [Candidatus Hydrogenedentes bacterium ADurb.Bin179]|nr:MAG: hypothetical protein BWY09_02657 [Candidatus Hydrogenedentes bacterium ADurb.Bin179]